MKKILLLAATTAAISSSFAFAENNGSFTSVDNGSATNAFDINNFYIKVSGGANLTRQSKLKSDEKDSFKEEMLKSFAPTKANIAPLAAIALGYSFTENLRGELEGSYVFNPVLKKSDNLKIDEMGLDTKYSATQKLTLWTGMASLYYDVLQVQNLKLFIGAGAGVAYTKATNSLTINGIPKSSMSEEFQDFKSKGKFNLAGHLTAGVSTEIAEGMNAELSYRAQYYGKPNLAKEKTKDKDKDLAAHLYSHNIMVGIRFNF